MAINLEQVFLVSGVPTLTFVYPPRFDALKISLRTAGRCAVIEGPSGIGKTSSIRHGLQELNIDRDVVFLSARKMEDRELIQMLPDMTSIGTVVVDDFHVLDDEQKRRLADFMKILADESRSESKLILIGINKAGDHLVQFGDDIGLRIDIFRMESNPDNKIDELITKGENALNIKFADKDGLVDKSEGSFQIAQMLCHDACILGGITESQPEQTEVNASVELIVDVAMEKLRALFHTACVEFARGSKIRREGRAPYLHILKWLAESEDWSLDLRHIVHTKPEHRGSIGQVIDKNFLVILLRDKADILGRYFHFQAETAVLTVEDPRLVFYLKGLVWRKFTRDVGYTTNYFKGVFDIALSFAGEDRHIAKLLHEKLTAREIAVFYDANEQHRMLAKNVEDYLARIYRTEAAYVVPLLSPNYPKKIWTKFESDNFKHRFGEDTVIPIRFSNYPDSPYSLSSGRGGLSIDETKDINDQIEYITETIAKRLQDDKLAISSS